MGLHPERVRRFERETAVAMSAILTTHWIAGPLAGVLVGKTFDTQLDSARKTVLADFGDRQLEAVQRAYRANTGLMTLGGAAPYVGSVVCVLDLYGRGRFFIATGEVHKRQRLTATDPEARVFRSIWKDVEPSLFDSDEILGFVERFSGVRPESATSRAFGSTVDELSRLYREKIRTMEGFDEFQRKQERVGHLLGKRIGEFFGRRGE